MSEETASGVVWQKVWLVQSDAWLRVFDARVYEYADDDWSARGKPWPGATPDDLGRYSSLRCPCGNRVDLPPDTWWREMTGWWLRCECRIFIHRGCGQGEHQWGWTSADERGWAVGRMPRKSARLAHQWRPTLWLGYKDKEHWVFDLCSVSLEPGEAALAATCQPAAADAAGRVLAIHCPECQTAVPLSQEGVDRVPSYVQCDHCPVESRDDDWGEGMAEFPMM